MPNPLGDWFIGVADRIALAFVAGVRPNFMKGAPVMAAVAARNKVGTNALRLSQALVHTGRHYDA